MKFSIDIKYRESIEALSKKKLKKYQCLFDINITQRAGFELEEEFMRIWYMVDGNTTTLKYEYNQLKHCVVFSNGYAIIFKDKKYVFLPVTNNEKSNNELMEIGMWFKNEYSAIRFIVHQRLRLPSDNHKNGKKRVSFDKSDSPYALITIAILGALASIIFIKMPNDYKPIERENAVVYEGIYESYYTDSKDYIEITFKDEKEYTIHECLRSREVYDKLDTLSEGEKLYVLENPEIGYIIELRTDKEEIINFDTSQAKMLKNAKFFMWMGICVDIAGVFLLAYGIYQLIAERKEDKDK